MICSQIHRRIYEIIDHLSTTKAEDINRNLYLKTMEVSAQGTFLLVRRTDELMRHCKVVAKDHESHKECCQVFAQLFSWNKQKALFPKSVGRLKRNRNDIDDK